MSMTEIYIIASVLVVSLISLIGVIVLWVKEKLLQKILLLLVSFSAGSLLGGAFLHLIPESFEEKISNTPILILAGIILFFVFEKAIHWRHCHRLASDRHPHPFSYMILFGDGLHNFLDGMIISAGFLLSPELGIATTLAVIFHEIPQEIGDFGSLVYAGFSKQKALLFNFLSALTAILGALLVLFWGGEAVEKITFLIPITAGGFIYIAMADLMPEMKKARQARDIFWQMIFLLAGIAVMFFMK